MNETKTIYDVFVSNGLRESPIATDITHALRSHGLKVFSDAEIGPGQSIEDAIWEALSESQSLVAIIQEANPSAWFAFEIGAANAWNKPIYAIASDPATARIPDWLQGIMIYPISRIEEIVRKIQEASGSLSETDQAVLIEEYHRLGVSVDRLLSQPDRLLMLTKQFKKRAKRDVAIEELMRTLLRLHKRGKLLASNVSKHPEAI